MLGKSLAIVLSRTVLSKGRHSVRSKLQNLQKAVIKDEVKETELQLQETRDREAIRITEEEVGRVGRDWGMLRSLQKHGQRKPSEEDLKARFAAPVLHSTLFGR